MVVHAAMDVDSLQSRGGSSTASSSIVSSPGRPQNAAVSGRLLAGVEQFVT